MQFNPTKIKVRSPEENARLLKSCLAKLEKNNIQKAVALVTMDKSFMPTLEDCIKECLTQEEILVFLGFTFTKMVDTMMCEAHDPKSEMSDLLKRFKERN